MWKECPSLEPVIDRETKNTDIVSIDFAGTVDGQPIKGGSAKNYRLDLGDNNFIDGFADQLVGHKLSEEFTIKVTFPADYHDKALAAKPAEFVIKLNDISQKVTPELSDELAQKLGPYETLAQLKEEVQKVLKQSEEQENNFRKQKALVEAVIEKANVEIPETMVKREAGLLKEEIEGRLRAQGMTWQQFAESQGLEATMKNLHEEAGNRIKTSLVFGAIAKDQALKVSDEEFSAQVREMAAMRGVDEKNVMRHLGNNYGAAQALSDQILSQKIVDYLTERANFTFVAEAAVTAKKDAKEAKAGKKEDKTAVAEAIEGEKFDKIDEE